MSKGRFPDLLTISLLFECPCDFGDISAGAGTLLSISDSSGVEGSKLLLTMVWKLKNKSG